MYVIEGNKDLVNGHYYTLTERMDDYDYEKVGVVRFRMSSAYIITPGFDITDFKLWKVAAPKSSKYNTSCSLPL